MNALIRVLMDRDGMSRQEAREAVMDARQRLLEQLEAGEDCLDFMMEEFGLEPDYLECIL